MDKVTYRLTIRGVVQGVGMRFFVKRTSSKFGITGYVKNIYTGDVECIAQGYENNIDAFITYIKKNSPGVVDDILRDKLLDYKEYTKFQFKF